MLGQFVEGNILTPKLVGSSVGLHPVWLLFALSVFGSLFGFVGMLVAVPVAAVIGVLARFGIDQYKDSLLYRGTADGTNDGRATDIRLARGVALGREDFFVSAANAHAFAMLERPRSGPSASWC